MNKETLLIIPAYNEEMNIEATLNGLLEDGINRQMDILVINDGSSDNTLKLARTFEPEIKIIDQVYNMGYGAALQTGYKYAVKHHYSYLLQMDADGQHDRSNLRVLLSRLKGETGFAGIRPLKRAKFSESRLPDIVIGSRFLEGGGSFEISGMKKMAIRFFTFLIRRSTGYRLTDPTSGLQGLNLKAFGYYSKYLHFDIRYPDLNMIVQMIFLGFQVEETPAIMHERTAGVSMHTGFWHSFKYMAVMMVSTFNSFTRYYRVYRNKGKD